ncbi:endonuclease/exonuclease/phosphatase family protein [Thalassospira xianhensis]|uniref:endonuclease/exonuclease/phosphatase family protein n=1 Tax=Thalassospira xianhensis TaxID=478503 RepID=UPI0011BDDCB5|nr:endonuclease/exonuclease/phosphatase family protein [Thalassospira xianhensis]
MKCLVGACLLSLSLLLNISMSHAETLSVASFNIQFLGSFKKRDDVALAKIVAPFDMVVVQELVAPPVAGTYPDGSSYQADIEAKEFVDAMAAEGFSFVLSSEDTGTGDQIHTGGTGTEWFITFYKPERVTPAPELPSGFLAGDRSNHPDYERVPYATGFKAPTGPDFVLISVHLMPGARDSGRRKHELDSIAAWINAQNSSEQDFIILGDMNIEDCDELASAVPEGFVSLNNSCLPTNTNVNGPKPYDHVLYRPAHSPEVLPNFAVLDLINATRPYWDARIGEFPGALYDHNTFRQYYSDHHPVLFEISLETGDDDGK